MDYCGKSTRKYLFEMKDNTKKSLLTSLPRILMVELENFLFWPLLSNVIGCNYLNMV